jgi:hypothetical protein
MVRDSPRLGKRSASSFAISRHAVFFKWQGKQVTQKGRPAPPFSKQFRTISQSCPR